MQASTVLKLNVADEKIRNRNACSAYRKSDTFGPARASKFIDSLVADTITTNSYYRVLPKRT